MNQKPSLTVFKRPRLPIIINKRWFCYKKTNSIDCNFQKTKITIRSNWINQQIRITTILVTGRLQSLKFSKQFRKDHRCKSRFKWIWFWFFCWRQTIPQTISRTQIESKKKLAAIDFNWEQLTWLCQLLPKIKERMIDQW